jgi:hypothetical protein
MPPLLSVKLQTVSPLPSVLMSITIGVSGPQAGDDIFVSHFCASSWTVFAVVGLETIFTSASVICLEHENMISTGFTILFVTSIHFPVLSKASGIHFKGCGVRSFMACV